jgi:hypothetical protein
MGLPQTELRRHHPAFMRHGHSNINGITRSQADGEEIDYVSYSIGEVHSI